MNQLAICTRSDRHAKVRTVTSQTTSNEWLTASESNLITNIRIMPPYVRVNRNTLTGHEHTNNAAARAS